MAEIKVKIDLEFVNTCLIVILISILLINIYLMSGLGAKIQPVKPSTTIQQTTNPQPQTSVNLPQVELIGIVPSDCKDCFDLNALMPQLNNLPGANVTKQEVISQKDAKELIEKYGLKKLPALILKGEIKDLKLPPDFVKKEDVVVLENLPPPYLDLASGDIKGKVSIIVINNPACIDCKNLSVIADQLKAAGVFIDKQSVVNVLSKDGAGLISKYDLENVPTVILSQEILDYAGLKESLEAVSKKAEDGSLVLVKVPPPYYELSSQRVRGNVDAIVLTDKTCVKCVNATTVNAIFTQVLGLTLKSEKELDISSEDGKKIVAKYNITQVPSILFSDELSVYPAAQQWDELGTKEDKWYVFRNVVLLGNFVEGSYKDLIANKEVALVAQQ